MIREIITEGNIIILNVVAPSRRLGIWMKEKWKERKSANIGKLFLSDYGCCHHPVDIKPQLLHSPDGFSSATLQGSYSLQSQPVFGTLVLLVLRLSAFIIFLHKLLIFNINHVLPRFLTFLSI